MFADAPELPDRTVVETDICIVGGGAAGITLAREFAGRSQQVLLLEGGGLESDAESQSLYGGESIGLPYEDLDGTRSRYLGGSTNCWGGWSQPLDDLDFEARSWVPYSGWPISRADLDGYYTRARALCELGPHPFDLEYWRALLPAINDEVCGLDRIDTIATQFSPPTRFGKRYRDDLVRAPNINVLLHANVVRLEQSHDGGRVDRVVAATLDGRELTVAARVFVLAAGGIENARLLLLSDSVEPAGLGNRHDMVGRFFMEHPRVSLGRLAPLPRQHPLSIMNVMVNYRSRGLRLDNGQIALSWTPSRETQAVEAIPNSRTYLESVYTGRDTDAVRALIRLRQMLRRGRPVNPARELKQIISGLDQAVLALVAKYTRMSWLSIGTRMTTVVEPLPNPDSRVRLSQARDRLGLRRTALDWQLDGRTLATVQRTQEVIRDGLAGLGYAAEIPDAENEPTMLKWCWHHMGTTRMSADPRHGVVDSDCRVHGIDNLFIAGSSVFPTCGKDMPTLTIVALALRLAERIRADMAAPSVVRTRGAVGQSARGLVPA